MSFQAAERLAQALLFEGYVLYPYRASSLKNRQRWPFGTLYPPEFCEVANAGDASLMRTECLVFGEGPEVRVAVRFLQLLARRPENDPGTSEGWHEAIERRVESGPILLEAIAGTSMNIDAEFPESRLVDSGIERVQEALCVRIEVSATRCDAALSKLAVVVRNPTPTGPHKTDRPAAQLRALVSTHTLLGVTGGRFVSLLEPPTEYAGHVAACHNIGTWPVLVGDPSDQTMLSSPVILYDRPCVAKESAGDLFDATEIDEILTLRILALTEDERRAALATDPRARALIERTEALGERERMALHGTWRPRGFAKGDRVVLRPGPHGDVLDLALAGEPATVIGVEEDFEGRVHYTVTVDADPGRDLGELGQPGHRFFFSANELERLS